MNSPIGSERPVGAHTILLTGVTGFLGRHILWDLLRRSSEGTKIYCLLRPDEGDTVAHRLQRLLVPETGALPAGVAARCEAVVGDIVDENIFRDPAVGQRLLGEVDRIVHCAATVKFNMPLQEARRINVDGTRHVLEFARALQARGHLQRVDHFSTAFVAGTTGGLVYEHELRDTGFHNTYEQTKWEAERVVRDYQQDLPIAIIRPSVIVGDSRTGYTSNFRVLYWPLKVLASGLAVVVPADRKGIVDVVPVNYVVDAFTALSETFDSLGKCFHLVAGPEQQSSCGELMEMGCEFFGVRPPYMVPPQVSYRYVRPLFYAVFWGKRRALLRTGEMYFPYFAYRGSFDASATEACLAPAGIRPPSVAQYFRNIMQYCIDTDWGRKRPKAPAVAAET